MVVGGGCCKFYQKSYKFTIYYISKAVKHMAYAYEYESTRKTDESL